MESGLHGGLIVFTDTGNGELKLSVKSSKWSSLVGLNDEALSSLLKKDTFNNYLVPKLVLWRPAISLNIQQSDCVLLILEPLEWLRGGGKTLDRVSRTFRDES